MTGRIQERRNSEMRDTGKKKSGTGRIQERRDLELEG